MPELEIPLKKVQYNAELFRLGLRLTEVVLLSRVIYWAEYKPETNGQFYKTDKDWQDELGLTGAEITAARAMLVKRGFIHTVRKGLPAKTYYTPHIEHIHDLLCGDGEHALTIEQIIEKYSKDINGAAVRGYARALKAGVYAEHVDFVSLIISHGQDCGYCGDKMVRGYGQAPDDMVVVHIRSLAEGGTHVATNLHPVHKKCQAMKAIRPTSSLELQKLEVKTSDNASELSQSRESSSLELGELQARVQEQATPEFKGTITLDTTEYTVNTSLTTESVGDPPQADGFSLAPPPAHEGEDPAELEAARLAEEARQQAEAEAQADAQRRQAAIEAEAQRLADEKAREATAATPKASKGRGKPRERPKGVHTAQTLMQLVPGLTEREFDAYIHVRKIKSLGDLSEVAWEGIAREIEKAGWDVYDALKIMIMRGWGGLNSKWLAEYPNPRKQAQQQQKPQFHGGGGSYRDQQRSEAAGVLTGSSRRRQQQPTGGPVIDIPAGAD